MYLGMITLGGFHDRYLIPVCMFFIVWVVSDLDLGWEKSFRLSAVLVGLMPFLLLALLAVLGTHDFMDMKRSQKEAQDYLVHQMNVQPCDIDGGLEFNGYHCYSPDFRPHEGLSWWWVQKEDYLITLGPLPDYQVVRSFPFKRYFGPDGLFIAAWHARRHRLNMFALLLLSLDFTSKKLESFQAFHERNQPLLLSSRPLHQAKQRWA
jgi:hypothetical protein